MPFLTHKHKKNGHFKSFEGNYNDFLLIYDTPLLKILQKVIMKSAGKFVIQQHTRDGETHWDWMFEAETGLDTWQVGTSPLQWTGHAVAAKKIFDHDAKFLTYEGSVNKGAGTVKIAERGTYGVISKDQQEFEMELNGEILKGRFLMQHIDGQQWQFSFAQRG